jgi:dipeptidyl aminopeptidase/acylaminoacyl peptidase
MRMLNLIAVLILFAGLEVRAEIPQPPIEAYGALPQIARAELSPDGTKVAAIANLPDDTRMVVFDLASKTISQQLGVSNIKARDVEFYDDNHVILRVSQTTSTYGFRGEYEYSGAFSYNLETQDTEQLLKRTPDLYPAQSGLGRIVGRGEKYGEVLMPAYVGTPGSTPRLNLMRVNLSAPRGRRYARGTHDTIDWFVGEKGNVLARERYDNDDDLYRVQTYSKKKWTTIYEEEDEILPVSMLGVMPDESGLVHIRVREDGFHALMSLGFDGEFTGPILPPKDREIESYYTDSNRKILGVRYAGAEPDYAFLDTALQESYAFMSEQFPQGTIYLDSWSDDRNVILYQVFDYAVGDVWVTHKRATGDLALVARRRPDIPAEALGAMMNIEYRARDDLAIQAILTTPGGFVQGTSDPLPAIVLPHGGPASYDRFDFDWMAQYFANRGYAVFQPNFRGSTGFGQEFEDAGRGEWGGKMQDDITDGIDGLVEAKIIDPDRVCIAGASYGGYAALAGAVFTPEKYKCVIAIAPVSDLNQMLRSEKRERGSDHWVISYWEDVMAEGDARREKLRAISPANHAERVQAPVLLLHGNDDTVVPFAQSTKMRNALRRADKSVELIKLKGEDHWLSVAETRMQTLREMDRFIAEHLPLEN